VSSQGWATSLMDVHSHKNYFFRDIAFVEAAMAMID
jgi:hypothetical protein